MSPAPCRLVLALALTALACTPPAREDEDTDPVRDAGTDAGESDGGGTDGGGATCGNGRLDVAEKCDPGIAVGAGACPQSCLPASCATFTLVGTASTCRAQCVPAPITACTGGDGCCPDGCLVSNDVDCEASCGNGRVEPGELCDGVCPVHCNDGSACTTDLLVGSAGNCDANCQFNAVTSCVGGDGCCPGGCTRSSDSDCSASCGNGALEVGETCDGDCPTACDDFNGCTVDRLVGSAGNCSAACTAVSVVECRGGDGCCPAGCNRNNDVDCSTSCGNAQVEAGETCDGNCPSSCNDGNACTIDTLAGSASQCSAQCSHQSIRQCAAGDGCCPAGCNRANDGDCSASCGNQVIEAGETCDGNCPTTCDDGYACTIDGRVGSEANCNVSCTQAAVVQCRNGDGCCPSGCTRNVDNDCSTSCGNAQVDPGETCDGDCPTSCDDFDACTVDNLSGNAAACNALCTHASVNQCANADGCCATGCTPANDSDCVGGGFPGDPCTSGGSCRSGACLDEATTDWADGYCTAACQTDSNCTSGSHCGYQNEAGDGYCLKDCVTGATCRSPAYECYDVDERGRLECGPVAHGPGQVGDACASRRDCSGGQVGGCIDNASWYEGYCSRECGPNLACPAGSHCGFTNETGEGVCVKDCSLSTQCRTVGYRCHDSDLLGGSECGPAATGSGVVGAPCTGIWECSGGIYGYCANPENWPSGYCLIACSPDQTTCPAGSECVDFDANDPHADYCLASCASTTPCRSGYDCSALLNSASLVCHP